MGPLDHEYHPGLGPVDGRRVRPVGSVLNGNPRNPSRDPTSDREGDGVIVAVAYYFESDLKMPALLLPVDVGFDCGGRDDHHHSIAASIVHVAC